MSLRVLYFAGLRDALGCAHEEAAADGIGTVDDLRRHLAGRGGPWLALLEHKSLKVAVNQTMASLTTPLDDGDEVAFFPPVTGG